MRAPSASRWRAFSVRPPSAFVSSVSATVSKRNSSSSAARERPPEASRCRRSRCAAAPHGVCYLARSKRRLATFGEPRRKLHGCEAGDARAVRLSGSRLLMLSASARGPTRPLKRPRPAVPETPPVCGAAHAPPTGRLDLVERQTAVDGGEGERLESGTNEPGRPRRPVGRTWPPRTTIRPVGVSRNEPGHGW